MKRSVDVAKAREAVTALRDAARHGGMHFRDRDPHVILLHAALDELADVAALLERVAQVEQEMRRVSGDSNRQLWAASVETVAKWASTLAAIRQEIE